MGGIYNLCHKMKPAVYIFAALACVCSVSPAGGNPVDCAIQSDGYTLIEDIPPADSSYMVKPCDCQGCRGTRHGQQSKRLNCPPHHLYSQPGITSDRVVSESDAVDDSTPGIPGRDSLDEGSMLGNIGQSPYGQGDPLASVPASPRSLVPNMFGDSYFSGGQIVGFDGLRVICDIPGARRSKIADNNSPLPRNRIFFNYQNYKNVGTVDSNFNYRPGLYDYSSERYTFGFEKMFFNGFGSIEFRLPFQQPITVDMGNFSCQNAETRIDNTSVNFKFLLSKSCRHALSAGLGMNLPSAGNVSGQVNHIEYTLANDTVYLAPFIGGLFCPNNRWFCEGFLQFDFAANGNRLAYHSPYHELGKVAYYEAQSLMHVDAAIGRWLYRTRQRRILTGLAGIVELHYTTTLQDSDSATVGESFMEYYNSITVSNRDNRVDVLNLTTGFHAELFHRTTLRVAAAVPLRSAESDRCFDSEIIVQVNHAW